MDTPDKVLFKQAWLCEAIAIKETEWGALDESTARLLSKNEPSPITKVIRRAQELGKSNGLVSTINALSDAGGWAVILMLFLAIGAGGIMSRAALGDGTQPVNIAWALVNLFLINFISLVFWLVAMFSSTAKGGIIVRLWPALTRKLAHGQSAGLGVQAWWRLWSKANATRWLLSTGTHLIWIMMSISALFTMLFLLSTRQYDFVWATTILTPEVFIKWTGYLATLPQWLGVSVPDGEIVRASGTVSQNNAENMRLLWSNWLISCLFLYGILPRALLALFSAVILAHRYPGIRPDLTAPYYVSVLSRLNPSGLAPEGSPPEDVGAQSPPTDRLVETWSSEHVLIAIELDPRDVWPPTGLGTAITLATPIDSRASRKQALENLSISRPNNLILACDARRTPDRGTLGLIENFCTISKRTLLWLRHSQAPDAHTEAWIAKMRSLPEVKLNLRDDTASVMQWLERQDD